jgi:hypothetical protein
VGWTADVVPDGRDNMTELSVKPLDKITSPDFAHAMVSRKAHAHESATRRVVRLREETTKGSTGTRPQPDAS